MCDLGFLFLLEKLNKLPNSMRKMKMT